MKLTTEVGAYELNQYELLNTELIAIERETGMSLRDWINALNRESIIALTGFVWISRRRVEGEGLLFDEVVFPLTNMSLDLGDTEPGKGEGTPPSSTDTSSRSSSDSGSSPGSSDASSTATPSP